MANELLDQGLILMLVGMGTVFAFLTVLVIATTVMSRILVRWQPAASHAGITDDEIAAITAAVRAHRQK